MEFNMNTMVMFFESEEVEERQNVLLLGRIVV